MALMTILCPDSFAAEEMTAGRKLYNTIMMWVNFGILVAVFLKFARKPLMDAIRGARDKIAAELSAIKKSHEDAESVLDSEAEKLKNIDQYLEEIRARIIAIGESEKERIIEQARAAAEKMVKDAEIYASFRIAKAKKEMSDEMVDLAISMVEKRLEQVISPEDNERLVNEFLAGLEGTKPQLN